jgi:hypothetical protein
MGQKLFLFTLLLVFNFNSSFASNDTSNGYCYKPIFTPQKMLEFGILHESLQLINHALSLGATPNAAIKRMIDARPCSQQKTRMRGLMAQHRQSLLQAEKNKRTSLWVKSNDNV